MPGLAEIVEPTSKTMDAADKSIVSQTLVVEYSNKALVVVFSVLIF